MSKESYVSQFMPRNIRRGEYYTQTVGIHPVLMRSVKLVIASSKVPGISIQSFINNLLNIHFSENEKDVRELLMDSFNHCADKSQTS